MANKKISELQTRTPSLTDLILVGDPSNGFSYKCTVSALATIIETDIADGYVTLGTTQTISGAKTFSNNLTLTSVANASTDPDKFLVLNGSNVVNYRTGSEVLSDIGGQGTITLTTTGTSGAATFAANTLNIPQYQGVITLTTTGTSGAATLVGNTLNIPNYAPDLSGYVPTSRTITINGTTQDLSANRTYNVGTVTSVAASGGTGISISGSPITSSGTITITNTAPDQVVALTAGTGISISGTYPNFTITNSSPSLGGTVTSVALSAPTGFAVTGSPITSSGTLALAFASGYSLPTTASQTNWDSAYNNMIVSAAVTGTTTKTLTLTQQDAGTITASWTDDNTDAVTSVFGRTGAVVAVSGDYNTSQVTESTNLYFTDARARGAISAGTGISYSTTTGVITSTITQYTDAMARASISLTTTGTSGAATYNSTTGVLNIPQYIGGVTSVFGRTGAVVAAEGDYSLTQLSDVTITTPSTGQVLKYNGTIWVNDTDANTGTVTSVALSAPTGFSVSGSPITSSGTLALSFASGYSLPTTASQTNWDTAYTNRITSLTTTGSSGSATLISNTLNIPTYTLAGLGGISLTSLSAFVPLSYNNTTGQFSITQSNSTNDGYLSATDWNTFNGKIGGSGTSNYVPKFTATSTLGNSQIFDNGTNVGINTATPSEKLEVSGILRVSRTTSASVYLNLIMENGVAGFDARGSIDQVFYTGALERMRIGFGGDVTISTIANATIDTDRFLVSDSGVIKYRTGSEILSDIGGQGALTLTTTGTSGAATLVGNTLNIPQYSGGGGTVSGTTNYIAKFTSSTAVGDSRFFDNGTVTFLGNGDVNATPSTGIFSGTGGTGTNIAGAELRIRGGASTGSGAGGPITFYTSAAGSSGTSTNAATEVARFTTTGRLGLGTNDPLYKLEIFESSTDPYMNFYRTTNSTGFGLGRLSWDGYRGTNTRTNYGYIQVQTRDTGNTTYAGELVFLLATGGSVNQVGFVNQNGNWGLNTNTIGSRLQVNGNAAIGYSASTAAPTNGLAVSGNVAIGTNTSSIPLTISTSTTQAVNILTSASITSGFTDIFEILAANQTGGGLSFNIGKARSTKNLGKIAYVHTSNGSNSNRMSWGFFDADNLLNLTAGGTLGVNTTTIGSTLQVNGNAAIGYSASTAAPTNGLIVAGQSTFSDNITVTRNQNAATRISLSNTNNNAGAYSEFLITTTSTATFGKFSASTTPVKIIGGSDFYLYNESAGDIALLNNFASGNIKFAAGGSSTSHMTITSGGQVTLGTGANVSAIAQTGYSLTGSNASSLIDLAGTWNTTGNPTAIKLNITNTASGASAYLMDLQVGGTTQFRVTKAGAIRTAAPTGGTANDWKLGTRVAATVVLDTTQYAEVEIGGTLYKLAMVN